MHTQQVKIVADFKMRLKTFKKMIKYRTKQHKSELQ